MESIVKHLTTSQAEACAAGDVVASAQEHLAECAVCADRVAGLRAEYTSEAPALDPEAFLRSVEQRASEEGHVLSGRWSRTSVVVGGALALAAGLLFALRPSPQKPHIGDDVPQEALRFKGQSVQLGVIRERAGQQARVTEGTRVKNGDRIRAELLLERSQTVSVVLVRQDGKQWSMLTPTALEPGVHYSPEAIRFDEERFVGYVLAGAPDAVNKAIAEQSYESVQRVHIETE